MKVIEQINKFRALIAATLLVAFSGVYICDFICADSSIVHDICLTEEMQADQSAQNHESLPYGHFSSTANNRDQNNDLMVCYEQICSPLFFGIDSKHYLKYINPVINHIEDFKLYPERIFLSLNQIYSNVLLPPKILNVRIFIQSFLN